MEKIILSNASAIPKIGFGTFRLSDEETCERAIRKALETGYMMIDTAYYYHNEEYVGKAMKSSGLKRNEYMIATKVWPIDFGYDKTLKSIERSLKSLETDYIDIMYLHWPGDDMEESYRAIERFYDEKVIKNIAIANFLEKHYEKLIKNANIPPVINQLEIHPLANNENLIKYYRERNVQIVSWSPLARLEEDLYRDEKFLEIAKKHKKTIPQIILAWHIAKNLIPIPKSSKNERIEENFDIFDINLSNEEIRTIDEMDRGFHVAQTPDDENWLEKIRYGK